MRDGMTRRTALRVLPAAGLGAAMVGRAAAQGEHDAASANVRERTKMVSPPEQPRYPAAVVDGKVIQPARPLPVMAETDVLVVGGGAAGFAAAVAAARAGAKTVLAERYGYFGGLWTGGLVLVVISSHATEGGKLTRVLRGVGGELIDRLATFEGTVVNHEEGKVNPTTDPEATKYMMDRMIAEAGVRLFLHCWAADVVMDGDTVRGAVFETKAGRQAILAKVVIDATGDGDIFGFAGAEHERFLHAVGLVHRLGNVDRADRAKLKAAGVTRLGSVEPQKSVLWVNLRGPSVDGLDVGEMTRLELEHRRAIWERVQKLRKTDGGDPLFLLQVAPQLGVRTTRLLLGNARIVQKEAKEGKKFPDTVAVGGAQNGKHVGWPIPYGSLLPRRIDGLLVAGRCVSTDADWVEDVRLIAPCLQTGHAAGAAAAIAAREGKRPRDIDVAALQALLREQGAYLG